MAKRRKPGCDLRDAGSCAQVAVDVARAQARRLLAAAERDVVKHPACVAQLASARVLFDSATGTGLELRNVYVRASYHVGQASACATQADAGPRQLTKAAAARAAKGLPPIQRKPKAPKAPKGSS